MLHLIHSVCMLPDQPATALHSCNAYDAIVYVCWQSNLMHCSLEDIE